MSQILLRSVQRQIPTMVARTAARPLSTQTDAAVDKLRLVLEEYRQQNFTQEVPTRFKKELLEAAQKSSASNNSVKIEGIEHVLSNIGAQDRISHLDLTMIFKEVGDEAGEIPSSRFLQII